MNAHNFSLGLTHVPQPGQAVSGDSYVADVTPRGMLACVMDGLGHGEKAHEAALKGVQAVRENLHEEPDALIKLCHRALTGTRGAVMSAAVIDVAQSRVAWAGVGNVAAVILPARGDVQKTRRHLMVHGGIVGYRLPNVRVFFEPFMPGDTLLFATDGIRSGFIDDIPMKLSPQEMAEYIYSKYNRGTDDSLVLALRYTLDAL